MEALWKAFKAYTTKSRARSMHALVLYDDGSGMVQDGGREQVLDFETPEQAVAALEAAT